MKRILILLIFIGFAYNASLKAQSKDYRLSGRVTTVENQILEGYITWSGNKMFWIDFFEASKLNNPYTHYFNPGDGIQFHNNGALSFKPPVHSFICRFGNIKKIRLTAYEQIELQIKDGSSIELKKGTYTSIGLPITINTGSENVTVKWEKISEIEFKTVNSADSNTYHIPITGVVRSNQGLYKGLISWDMDEKIAENTLDGKSASGDVSIAFRNILKIEKKKNSYQLLLSGNKEIEVWGTNDVNNQNRGTIVNMPNIGLVSIPWNNFEFMETTGLNEMNILSYQDFNNPERLYGEVETQNGKKVSGILAYDLDETMDFEVLDGKNDNISYKIPFKYIRSIEPKNYKYSFITLKNGNTLSLGDGPDVNDENSGIIVFSANQDPTYIPWNEIKLIKFQ